MTRRLKICLLGLVLLAPAVSFAAKSASMGSMVAVLDIGQYIRIRNTGPIKVIADHSSGDPFSNFKGCREITIDCNFRAQIRVSAKPISKAKGEWRATITSGLLERGTTDVEICVAGTHVMTHFLMGAQNDVPVAEVTIQVMAR